MTDYPDNEQDRKKALAANEKFCKPDDKEFAARTKIKELKSEIDALIKQRDAMQPRVIEFLHNSSWHLNQALKTIDEVKK